MIRLECTQSPDSNSLGTYEFQQNMIYLGRKDTDIITQDLSWPLQTMVFEVVEDQFYIHPQKELPFFLVNGKRSTGVKKIKPGELITIGHTVFKLIKFSLTNYPVKKQILDEKLQDIVNTDSPKLEVIRRLTEMMTEKR